MMRKFGEGMQQLHAECNDMAGAANGDEMLLRFLQDRLEQMRFIAEHTKRHLDAQIQYEMRFQDALQRWVDGQAPVDYGFPPLSSGQPRPPQQQQRAVDDDEPIEQFETRRPAQQEPQRPPPRPESDPSLMGRAHVAPEARRGAERPAPASAPLRVAPPPRQAPTNGASRAPKQEEPPAPPVGAMLHSIYSSYGPRAEEPVEEPAAEVVLAPVHDHVDHDHHDEVAEARNSKANGPSAPAAPSSDDVVD